MSVEIARYQFLSWARRGIAGSIGEADDLGAGTAATIERVTVSVGVSLNSTGLTKNFALIGPGDIIGIKREMIVRTEPLNWVTDFESNYLAFVEFYDEDFAWRYTPAAPVGNRLRPWIALVVLKNDEFERSKRRVPLPSITIKAAAAFPPSNETWMWAHVHSHADIPDSELSDYERFLLSLNRTANDDPDQVYCRLMCPRKLEPQTQYSAFLIPAFESGRLAGLEQPTDTVAAQMTSWTNAGPRGEMPFYYEWFFRTGVNADFESLVRALQPLPMPATVGIRDMDCHKPGFVKADGTGELPSTVPALLGLEGAVMSPTTTSTVFPDPPEQDDFRKELQEVVNLPFEIVGAEESQDPIISLPLYGGKHAKKSATDLVKLDITKPAWVHELNRDPRWRVCAGFGTSVVQTGQEEYMRKAWAQADRIIAANTQIKKTRFYMNVGMAIATSTLFKLPQSDLLAITKPVLSKVMGSSTTLLHQMRRSLLPPAALSGAFRRIVRPRAAFAKRLGAEAQFTLTDLVERINSGNISAAPPRDTPRGMPNTGAIASAIQPVLPRWLGWLLRHRRLVLALLLVVVLLLGVASGSWAIVAAVIVVIAAASVAAERLARHHDAAESLRDPSSLEAATRSVPPRRGFSLQLADESPPLPTMTAEGADSVEAANFRRAMLDFGKRVSVPVPEVQREPLDLVNAYTKARSAIDPKVAFPKRLARSVKVPTYVSLAQPQLIYEAMAYPDFEEPMYKGLVAISSELILPNLKLVPINTITLLKTNQRFIESYLVGLNHEMGRELLWREYPTDERGSYFRQFWDVNGLIRPERDKTEAELAEGAKDIKPIHAWQSASVLGLHNNRGPQAGDQTVLLVRGDLLKRYPNTVIFAQKAIPGASPEESLIDADLTAEEFATHLKFPLYRAELPPDIKLFGFDLTIDQARGTESTPGFSDSLGWFFVIQEAPGEPRFGMDISFEPGTDGLSWDDLAWDRLPASTQHVTAAAIPDLNVADKSRWGTDSANMAYVLFQKPNMIAVHATEMLSKLEDRNA